MKNTLEGRWLIDSNLIIYFQDVDSRFHQDAKLLFSNFLSGKVNPIVCQQNILEVENVLIRQYREKARSVVDYVNEILEEFGFSIITPLSTTHVSCQKLLLSVPGQVDVFDYFLAATMLDNMIDSILTVNTKDFAKIPQINAVNPFEK